MKNLKVFRKKHGFTQADLAKKINVSQQAIARWETNTAQPSLDNLHELSKVFQISFNDLLANTSKSTDNYTSELIAASKAAKSLLSIYGKEDRAARIISQRLESILEKLGV